MENIVLQDERKEHIKIVDFGLSNIYTSNDPLRTHCGSPEYAAPELFIVGKRYGPEVDLWSLGVVLYGMTTGRLPFLCPRNEWTSSEERRRRLMIQINKGLTTIQERAMCQISNDCRNLINRLLVTSACERITIREILDHPWILGSSKSNFHHCTEDSLNIFDHLAIVNKIATVMRTSAATVEAEIITRKYGEIGGMYNIKIHELYQKTFVANRLKSRAPRNSSACKDTLSSTVTIKTMKDNSRNGISKNSCNTNRSVIMRHDQIADRSVKKSLLHCSTTWNWRYRSGNENHSSEERRNSKIRHDTSTMNSCLSSKQYHLLQIKRNQSDKISQQGLYRSIMSGDGTRQQKDSIYYANSKRTEKDRAISKTFKIDCGIIPGSILQTQLRISSASTATSNKM